MKSKRSFLRVRCLYVLWQSRDCKMKVGSLSTIKKGMNVGRWVRAKTKERRANEGAEI